jgi:hypothetical protein
LGALLTGDQKINPISDPLEASIGLDEVRAATLDNTKEDENS